jgi:hypothetical protein
MPERPPHVLPQDDPLRPFYTELRQGLLLQLNALDRLLGFPTPPARRRGRGGVRVWHNEDESAYEALGDFARPHLT